MTESRDNIANELASVYDGFARAGKCYETARSMMLPYAIMRAAQIIADGSHADAKTISESTDKALENAARVARGQNPIQ